MIVKVKTQAEFESARQNPDNEIWVMGSELIEINGSSQVRAYGSSQVTAYGSSQVRAYGSSQVRACDSSQVRACDSSQVTASKQVAVTVHGKKSKVTGGVRIDYLQPATVKEWLANYNIKVEKGVVVLYKGLDKNFMSPNGGNYTPGTTPSAPDFAPEPECGKGLHFSPIPAMTLRFNAEAVKFVACPVKVSDIILHLNAEYPDKVKAPRVYKPCWEVDIHGNKV